MRTGVDFDVSDEQRRRLEAIAGDGNSKVKHARRARIVLLTDDGLGTMAVMAETGSAKATVWRWQERFMREGVDGLLRDKTRPPGKPRTSEEKVREVVELARSSAPEGETHWTVRALAEEVGLSPTTVHKILVRHRLAPHKVRQFKVSTDPKFAEKTRDVIELYMNPPDRAVVLVNAEVKFPRSAKAEFPSFWCFGGEPVQSSVRVSFLGRPRFFGGGGGVMGAFVRTCSGMRSACFLSL